MGRVIAVVGMPGSGKGVFARIAAERGIPVFSMGDIVREALRLAGEAETPESVGATALAMREAEGEAIIAERMLERLAGREDALLIIEGVRQPEEMEIFRAAFGAAFTTLAIRADAEARIGRIAERGRGEDGDASAFDARDARESAWGLPELVAAADASLANDSDLPTFEAVCAAWLGEA